ncbi:hypothetical protein lerEdw1_015810 [Lerista edwardsae]|nr:hypothetical protein lerEdw1_015810 [Lerista edwardsae]
MFGAAGIVAVAAFPAPAPNPLLLTALQVIGICMASPLAASKDELDLCRMSLPSFAGLGIPRPILLLPPEAQDTGEAELSKALAVQGEQGMNPRKTAGPFHVLEQTQKQSSQRTTFWKVLQEDDDRQGSEIKVENSLFGGSEPVDTLRGGPGRTPASEPVTAAVQEEGGASHRGRGMEPLGGCAESEELPEGLGAADSNPSPVDMEGEKASSSKYCRSSGITPEKGPELPLTFAFRLTPGLGIACPTSLLPPEDQDVAEDERGKDFGIQMDQVMKQEKKTGAHFHLSSWLSRHRSNQANGPRSGKFCRRMVKTRIPWEPLQEWAVGALDVKEESLDEVQGQSSRERAEIFRDPQQDVTEQVALPGLGLQPPTSVLPPKDQATDEDELSKALGVQAEQVMKQEKTGAHFHVVEQTPKQSSQRTTFWKVLQEDGENVDSVEGSFSPQIDLASEPVKKEETSLPDPLQSQRDPDNDSGLGITCPPLSLLPEDQDMAEDEQSKILGVQVDQGMNLRNKGVPFHRLEQTPVQSSQQTTFWKVLQEDSENLDSLGTSPSSAEQSETSSTSTWCRRRGEELQSL